MGKNAKFKAIRKLAKIMPDVMVKGANGTIQQLDHARNMKNLYKVHGAKGVQAYILNVESHTNKASA